MHHFAKIIASYVLVGIVCTFVACNRSTPPAASPSESPNETDQVESKPFQSALGERVRVLTSVPRFRLTDQSGKLFTSQNVEGKVWVASFIFTRCQETCPAQTAEFQKLQKLFLNHEKKDDLYLVSLSVDPEHDTPAVLAEYAERYKADPNIWSFVTTKREVMKVLSEQGFKLPLSDASSDPAQPITHSQQFILVDRARRIRGYYDGLNAEARTKLLNDLEIVLNDPPGAILEAKQLEHNAQPGSVVYQPREIKDPAWMAERAAAQAKIVANADLFHDFQFEDKLPESGITFVNKVVNDASRTYKGVHYDHGNGVSIADVDNDGHYDIYFVNQIGANHLYKNLGNGKFQDITTAAGVAIDDRVCVTASFADIDNDGDQDLYVTAVRDGNLLFENDGNGKFTDISESSGLNYAGHSSAAVFFDFDRDGLLDVFLSNPGKYTMNVRGDDGSYIGFEDAFFGHNKPERTEQSILYRNLGNKRFEDVSQKMGLVNNSWTGASTPIDLNQDGWLDLYVVNMQGHDEYYENDGGRRFVKKSREIFPRTSWGAMGVKSFDFDNDSRMDLFVTDMHTDMIDEALKMRRFWHAEKMKMTDVLSPRYLNTDGNHVLGNSFFHNRGNGKFVEVSDDINVENYWPWGLSVGDLNADGFEDIFITASMNYPFRYGVNSLLLNHRGHEFVDAEFVVGVEPRRDNRTAKLWFTLDADDRDKTHKISRGRSGKVDVYGALGSRSSVIFDIDGDGDLDIITNDFHSEPMVLVSNLSAKISDLKYVLIDLEGVTTNRNGLGAIVQVTIGDRVFTKVHDGQSGYLSQSDYPLYFGLGNAKTIDKVEVTWFAGGKKQTITGPIEPNQTLKITEK